MSHRTDAAPARRIAFDLLHRVENGGAWASILLDHLPPAIDARDRALVRRITVTRKPRIATKPSRSSQRKRMDSKTKRGRIKALRRRVDE
mgnify:CR=1 FL=1